MEAPRQSRKSLRKGGNLIRINGIRLPRAGGMLCRSPTRVSIAQSCLHVAQRGATGRERFQDPEPRGLRPAADGECDLPAAPASRGHGPSHRARPRPGPALLGAALLPHPPGSPPPGILVSDPLRLHYPPRRAWFFVWGGESVFQNFGMTLVSGVMGR